MSDAAQPPPPIPGDAVAIDSHRFPGADGIPVLPADAQAVLTAALAPDLRDDRFLHPTHDWAAAVIERQHGRPTGLLSTTADGTHLVVDGLLVETTADRTDPATTGERARRLWSALRDLVDAHPPATAPTTLQLWGRPARPWHERLATDLGLNPSRALHQLRCPLPLELPLSADSEAPTIGLTTRAFVPGVDDAALVEVNNRAFAHHPDQGTMTVEGLRATMAEPWFDPDGLRVLDDPEHPGRMAGFCWTKTHRATDADQPPLGEIYVIGLDPDHHGRGLGVPMTAAGLRWLGDRGLTVGMLYVEADNHPAIRTYRRLGFVDHRTDRAWAGPLPPPASTDPGDRQGAP